MKINELVMENLKKVESKLKDHGFTTKIMTNDSESCEDWNLLFGHDQILMRIKAVSAMKKMLTVGIDAFVDELEKWYKGTPQNVLSLTELVKHREWVESHLTVRVLSAFSETELDQTDRINQDTKFEGIRSFLYLNIEEKDARMGTYVSPAVLQAAGISQDEAWECASKNVAVSCEIKSMKEILIERYPEFYDTEVAVSSLDAGIPEPEMYVMTNESAAYGAAAILNDEVLRDFGERIDCRQMIAIPSSIHEFILLRASDGCDAEGLREMIRSINLSEVLPEERLGDFPYLITISSDEVQVSALNGSGRA